jgi:hypothetical protein
VPDAINKSQGHGHFFIMKYAVVYFNHVSPCCVIEELVYLGSRAKCARIIVKSNSFLYEMKLVSQLPEYLKKHIREEEFFK